MVVQIETISSRERHQLSDRVQQARAETIVEHAVALVDDMSEANQRANTSALLEGVQREHPEVVGMTLYGPGDAASSVGHPAAAFRARRPLPGRTQAAVEVRMAPVATRRESALRPWLGALLAIGSIGPLLLIIRIRHRLAELHRVVDALGSARPRKVRMRGRDEFARLGRRLVAIVGPDAAAASQSRPIRVDEISHEPAANAPPNKSGKVA